MNLVKLIKSGQKVKQAAFSGMLQLHLSEVSMSSLPADLTLPQVSNRMTCTASITLVALSTTVEEETHYK